MDEIKQGANEAARPKRADARRNEAALLGAAAAVFVRSGVEAPVRDIAAEAGVGTATIYRHFPTRADLIIAVYRHQVEACAEAGPALLAAGPTPYDALGRWIDMFVDFLVTKHGLAAVLRGDSAGFESLHGWFLDRLVPVCTRLLGVAADAGEIRSDIEAYELMRGVGNLCAGAGDDPRYDARRLAGLLIAGLRENRLPGSNQPRFPGSKRRERIAAARQYLCVDEKLRSGPIETPADFEDAFRTHFAPVYRRSMPDPLMNALTCPTNATCYAAGSDAIPEHIGNTYNDGSAVVAVTHDAGRTWQRVTFDVPARVPGGMQGDSFMDIGQIQCPQADACVAMGISDQGSTSTPIYTNHG